MTLLELVKKHKRTYIIGNGGSYANSIHLCNDFLDVGIKAYTLDPASLTRTANDRDYREVFAEWIEVVGESGDLLLCLSGSGNSKNIIHAIRQAKSQGMTTACIIGAFTTGRIRAKDMCHYYFQTGKNMQAAEAHQIILGHRVYRALKK